MNDSILGRSLRHALVAGSVAAGSCLVEPASGQCELSGIQASDGAENDQFGDAVAMSGSIAVVGASRHDFWGNASGAAYVLRLDVGEGGLPEWAEETRLLADDGLPADLFGFSVAVDENAATGATIVVGAYWSDHAGGVNAGAAYVFTSDFPGAAWVLVQKLVAPDAAANDEFGRAVAVSGDVLAVGAPRDDHDVTGDADTGSVWTFRWNGSSWAAEEKLVASAGAAHDRLGTALAVDGAALVVGAALDDHAGLSSGAAYVFRDNGAAWLEEAKLVADDASAGDKFGEAVAISGDLVLVGAHLDDDVTDNSGSAYVFRYDRGFWLEPTKITASDATQDDQFGRALAVFDGPGDEDSAVVGAAAADAAAGAAYAFVFDGVDWIETARLTAAAAEAGAEFGYAVSAADGYLMIGANKDDDAVAGGNAGAVYVFLDSSDDCTDCDGDGTLDALEIEAVPALDCNANGMLDTCEIDAGSGAPGGPFYCTEDCAEDCNDNGIPDECDIASGTSEDLDTNGVPDECEDCNGNGIADAQELFDGTAFDCNGNGIIDECDIAAAPSIDCDLDGVPDQCQIDESSGAPGGPFYCTESCDPDCNDNGIPDACDVADGEDCNDNGVPDECDVADGSSADDNGNNVPDECEDCDGNGIADFIEIVFFPERDCDDNEVLDVCETGEDCTEACQADCDGNGRPDSCDIADGILEDVNGNGIADLCEDCNGNGVLDPEDIGSGTSADCNTNGVPDECEILEGSVPGDFYCVEDCDADCNLNGIPDECEIVDLDCDGNGIPDDCDPDCNANGTPDACDIAAGDSTDWNGNGVPDECDPDCDGDQIPDFVEISQGFSEDCNGNEVPDECDIDEGTSQDANGDGIPDECTCPADLDASGEVGFDDLLSILSLWGSCPGCPEDLDGSGDVGFADLLVVLSTWGPCS